MADPAPIKPYESLADRQARYKVESDEAGKRILSFIRGAAKAITTDLPGFIADVADRLAGDTKSLGEKDRSEQMFSAVTGTSKKDAASETLGSFTNPTNLLKAIIVPAFLTKSLKTVKKAAQALNAGTDAAQVEKYTGIFRLPEHINDGVFRTVIDDSTARLITGPGGLERIGTSFPLNSGPSVFYRFAAGDFKTLGEVLDHPTLYNAIPDLKNTRIGHSGDMNVGNAFYSSANDYIGLSHMRSEQETIQALLHEIQHGVQDRFSMNTGGNPWMFITSPEKFKEAQQSLTGASTLSSVKRGKLNDTYDEARGMYNKLSGEAEARAVEAMYRNGGKHPQIPSLSYYGDEYDIARMIPSPDAVSKVDQDPVIQAIIRDALASKKTTP